ncbi:MAG: replicative DNA helicase [Polyangiaceae bacterium]|nr:replicative DNA helicase [Polyangiaceae bacterium]
MLLRVRRGSSENARSRGFRAAPRCACASAYDEALIASGDCCCGRAPAAKGWCSTRRGDVRVAATVRSQPTVPAVAFTPRSQQNRTPREPPIIAGKVPPHDLDAEAAVLSAILLKQDTLDQVAEILKSEHFYSEANGKIYEAAIELARQSAPIDIVQIASWLRDRERLAQIGGPAYLAQIVDATPAVAHVGAHARTVREKWRLRRLIAECQRVSAEGYGDVGSVQEFIDGAEQAVYELARSPEANSAQPISQVLRAAFEQISKAAERGDRITGVSTGYGKLDEKTAGLHDGDLTIIAARPGMGKTSFVLNLAVNVASPRSIAVPGPNDRGYGSNERREPGFGVAVFSLEMPREQLATRMVCSEARVDVGKLRGGHLTPEDWRKLTEAASFLTMLPIWLDDTPAIGLLEVRAKIRRMQAEYNRPATSESPEQRVGLVVIDYLQLMSGRPNAQSREQEISEISRGLKQLAKELRVPVIALSQLNRAVETRATKDKRPQLSDLRESGAIEQDADMIVFIYRDEYYNPETTEHRGLAEIIIAKQRNGPTGKVFTRFNSACTRFDNLQPGDYPEFVDD